MYSHHHEGDAIFIKIDLVQKKIGRESTEGLKKDTKEFDTKMHRKLDCLQLKVDHHVDDVFLWWEKTATIMKAKTFFLEKHKHKLPVSL